MGRRLRYIPTGGALVEVTTRTLHSRYLLRPTSWVNEVIVGVLARARKACPDLKLCGLVFMSNHYHLLLWVPDAMTLRRFMEFVNSNIAREVGRLVVWREKFWSRRYQHIVVSNEPAAQVARLRYILAHGVKEDLVHKPDQWPGVHGLHCLLRDEPLRGYWFDRTSEYKARLRGEQYERLSYATPELLYLDPLPCWQHLSRAECRERVRELLQDITLENQKRRRLRKRRVLGINGVKALTPYEAPRKSKKASAPRFHAISRVVRSELENASRAFYCAFQTAASDLKSLRMNLGFPEGSFPPALPFVNPKLLARPQPA